VAIVFVIYEGIQSDESGNFCPFSVLVWDRLKKKKSGRLRQLWFHDAEKRT
jgi:hypothetical protein